jgi:hypothetical protein
VRLKHTGNDYISSRLSQLLFRLHAVDNGFKYCSVRFKTLYSEIQQCKRGRNETQFLLLVDGSSQHLTAVLAFVLGINTASRQLIYTGNWKFKIC